MTALPRPRAVLFDWDSTLVDNWGAIARALDLTFRTMGRQPWTEEEVRANAKQSLRDTFPGLFGDRWEQAQSLFYSTFEDVHLDTLTVLPGAEDLLSSLNKLGVPMGVVSNKTGRYLRAEATHLGWTPWFHRIIGAQDAAHDKPAPDAIHMALEGSGVLAGQDVWFVGDSAVDLACAHAASCTAILLHPSNPHPENLHSHPPALHVAGCRDLLEHLYD